MTLSPAIALVALAAITLCFGGLGLADRPAQDGARKPSSLVPAARTDEWAIARENPSALAVICRSIGNGDPASAAAPSGLSFIRVRASAKRAASRPNIST